MNLPISEIFLLFIRFPVFPFPFSSLSLSFCSDFNSLYRLFFSWCTFSNSSPCFPVIYVPTFHVPLFNFCLLTRALPFSSHSLFLCSHFFILTLLSHSFYSTYSSSLPFSFSLLPSFFYLLTLFFRCLRPSFVFFPYTVLGILFSRFFIFKKRYMVYM